MNPEDELEHHTRRRPMPGIERYLGARAAANPAYSKATREWYFLMNLTDTFQVYGIAQAGAWPTMSRKSFRHSRRTRRAHFGADSGPWWQ